MLIVFSFCECGQESLPASETMNPCPPENFLCSQGKTYWVEESQWLPFLQAEKAAKALETDLTSPFWFWCRKLCRPTKVTNLVPSSVMTNSSCVKAHWLPNLRQASSLVIASGWKLASKILKANSVEGNAQICWSKLYPWVKTPHQSRLLGYLGFDPQRYRISQPLDGEMHDVPDARSTLPTITEMQKDILRFEAIDV